MDEEAIETIVGLTTDLNSWRAQAKKMNKKLVEVLEIVDSMLESQQPDVNEYAGRILNVMN